VKGAIKFLGRAALLVVSACASVEAQQASYEQRITDLDDKAAALEKRLNENANRSQRFNSFIADAKARLEAIRAGRTPLEPVPEFPKLPPPIEETAPLPQPVPLQPPQPPPSPPLQPVPDNPLTIPEESWETKGYYLQVFGGYLIPETVTIKADPAPGITTTKFPIESKDGFSSGIVFGRDFGKFRLENEISGRRYSHSTIDLKGVQGYTTPQPIRGYSSSVGALVNALYDIEFTQKFSMFLGVGVGANGAKVKLLNNSEKHTLFAYQLLAGYAWQFAERISTRFAYKYFTTAGSKDFERLDSHNLELGVQVDL